MYSVLTYVLIRVIIITGGEPMTYSELKKILKKNGCYPVKEGASHEIWFSSNTGKKFTVGRHNTQEIPTGTLKSIMKSAGID